MNTPYAIVRRADNPKERTWDSRGRATAALRVDSRNVALETPGAGLGKLGHVAHVIELRLEGDIRVILQCPRCDVRRKQ